MGEGDIELRCIGDYNSYRVIYDVACFITYLSLFELHVKIPLPSSFN